jgi:hypothetical protein
MGGGGSRGRRGLPDLLLLERPPPPRLRSPPRDDMDRLVVVPQNEDCPMVPALWNAYDRDRISGALDSDSVEQCGNTRLPMKAQRKQLMVKRACCFLL